MKAERGTGARARIAALALIALALSAQAPAAADTGRSSLHLVGILPLDAAERLVVDMPARRVIAIGGGAFATDPLRLTVFDGDTLRRIRVASFPPYLPQERRTKVPRVFAFDSSRRLLHIVVYDSSGPKGNTAQRNTLAPELLTVNVDSMTVVGAPRRIGLFPPGIRIMGVRLWGEGRLGLVGQAFAEATAPDSSGVGTVGALPPVAGAMAGEIDPATGEVAWGPVPLRGCQTVISAADQAGLARNEGSVFVACGTGSAGIFTAPGTPAVVEVPVDEPLAQSLYLLPGSYGDQGESYVDDRANRLLLVGSSADRPAQAVWVFDLAHRLFLGEIAGGDLNVNGAAVETTTGRIYVTIGKTAAEGSLLISTDRGIEIPQGRPFPLNAGVGPITPLPFNRTFVVPFQRPGRPDEFRVYRDPLPADAITPSHPFDYRVYDALVTDAPQFAGDAQAFGLRVHQIGGVDAVLQNLVFNASGGYYSQLAIASCSVPQTCVELKDRDRDLYFGRVRSAHLSQDEASAGAIEADVDPGTKEDVRAVARRSGGAVPEELPFEAAECRDFGDEPGSAAAEGSNVGCEKGRGVVLASAASERVRIPGVFSVAGSSSTTSVRLDPATGLVAEATAQARNVVIGDAVRIARITSTLRVAAGRSGAATATFTRSFEGVAADGFSCGTDCDPTEVLEAMTRTLGAQFRVELPAAELLATPRGFHAHVLREPWEHQQDVALQNQDPTELQVPALRVTHIGDNGLASRTIFEFAASKADVTSFRVGAGGKGSAPPPPLIPIPPDSIAPPPVGAPNPIPTAGGGGVVRRIIRSFGHGLRFAFGLGPRSVALWLVLAAPAFLFARRRHLLGLARRFR